MLVDIHVYVSYLLKQLTELAAWTDWFALNSRHATEAIL